MLVSAMLNVSHEPAVTENHQLTCQLGRAVRDASRWLGKLQRYCVAGALCLPFAA